MRMYGIGTAAVLSVAVPVLLSIHARGTTRPYQRHMRMHRNMHMYTHLYIRVLYMNMYLRVSERTA